MTDVTTGAPTGAPGHGRGVWAHGHSDAGPRPTRFATLDRSGTIVWASDGWLADDDAAGPGRNIGDNYLGSLPGHGRWSAIGAEDSTAFDSDRVDHLVESLQDGGELHLRSTSATASTTGGACHVSIVAMNDRDGEMQGYSVVETTDQPGPSPTTDLAIQDAPSRMEAIGRLAAGLTHEINTPLHFVGDNVTFLGEAFDEVIPLLRQASELVPQLRERVPARSPLAKLADEIKATDIGFLVSEIPGAIEQAALGLDRVGKIIRAMKDFSHPGTEHREPANLNQAVESAVAMATNEWKDIADVVLDLDPDIPPVRCRAAEIGQVLLIIVVNAAQAIAEGVEPGTRGTIRISTVNKGDAVEVRITDDGTGIPPSIQARVFDPFFTTKPVGKGTGQGLAIAHNVVVDNHQGTIEVASIPGRGSTFIVSLPVNGSP